jgi:multiple sugar transport system substrate-binding protein
MKQDFASGSIDYCAYSNHTSFAPQYDVITEPLDGLIAADVIEGFSSLVISHATVNGALFRRLEHVLREVALRGCQEQGRFLRRPWL